MTNQMLLNLTRCYPTIQERSLLLISSAEPGDQKNWAESELAG